MAQPRKSEPLDSSEHSMDTPVSTSFTGTVSGFEAVLRTLSAVNDTVVVSSDTGRRGIGISTAGVPNVRSFDDASAALSYSLGVSATGFAVGVMIDTSSPAALRSAVESAVTRQLPLTIIVSKPLSAISDSSRTGSHHILTTLLDLGATVLSASSAQQAVDLIVAARSISSLSFSPVIVHVDGRDSIWSLQRTVPVTQTVPACSMPTALGKYREMLLGSSPQEEFAWIDTNAPMEIGAPLSEDVGVKQRVGRHAFVQSDQGSLVAGAFDAVGELTGRSPSPLTFFGPEDAEVVLVTTGSLGRRLESSIDRAESDRSKIAVVTLAQVRPFPSAELATRLLRAKRICVVSVPGYADPDAGNLVQDVRAAIQAQLPLEAENPTRRRRKKGIPAAPIVFPLLCPDGWRPARAELAALADRLLSETAPRTLLAGTGVSGRGVRYPDVERVRQSIQASDIDLAGYEIDGASTTEATGRARILIVTRSGRDTWRLLRGVADLVAATGAKGIRAGFHSSSDGTTHPVVGEIDWDVSRSWPVSVLALGSEVFGTLPLREILPQSAHVLLLDPPDSIYAGVRTSRFPSWVAARDISITRIDLDGLDIPAVPIESVPDWALLGGLLRTHPVFEDADVETLVRSDRLAGSVPGSPKALLDSLESRMQAVPEEAYEPATGVPPEPEAPLEVVAAGKHEVPVADLNRFWRTTGILYREGRLDEAPADPFLASGALPARSGALTQQLLGSKPLPHVITERCTGCGSCWTVCPESAFSSSLFTLENLFDAALGVAESQGNTFLQLPRLRPAIVKTMHRLAGKDDLHQFSTGSELLEEAVSQVLEKAGLDDEKRQSVQNEIQHVSNHLADIRPIRTDRYFGTPEKSAKGMGRFLGLTIDPFACTTCGLCIASCDDAALERSGTVEQSATVQHEWHQLLDLDIKPPELPEEIRTAPERTLAPMALVGRSTDRVFRAGGADVGNVNRTVLRLFLESAGIISDVRKSGLALRVREAIDRIDDRIQDEVKKTFEINDFEAFARSLEEFSGTIDRSAMTNLVSKSRSNGDDSVTEGVSDLAARRKECAAWLAQLSDPNQKEATPYTVLVKAMSHRSFGLAGYPINPFSMPCYSTTADASGDLVSGVYDGLRRKTGVLVQLLDSTEQLLDGVFEPDTDPEAPGGETPHIDEESVPLVLLVTDRLGPDIMRVLADDRPVKILLLSGGLSASTPAETGINPVDAVLGLEHVYFHQTALTDPVTLLESFIRAQAYSGPALLHVYSPDPVRDGLSADDAFALTRLARESKLFPTVTRVPGRPLDAGSGPTTDTHLATAGDWMLNQERFSGSFSFVPRREWLSSQIPLGQWLSLSEEDRARHEPFLEKIRPDGLKTRYLAHQDVIDLTLSVERTWNRLQRLVQQANAATPADSTLSEVKMETRAPSPGNVETVSDRSSAEDPFHTLSERLLDLSGFRDMRLSLADWQSKKPKNGKESGEPE